MALIKCPECGKEISNKSQNCIHCGFPIQQQNTKLKNIIAHYPDGSTIIAARNLTENDATNKKKELEYSLSHTKSGLIIEVDIKYEVVDFDDPICQMIESAKLPHCPKCGSTAITTGARGVNWTLGLIGADKTVNRCGKCGHTWQPK